MQYYYPDELYHHGVKGMKWGIRHDKPRHGRRMKNGKPVYDKRDIASHRKYMANYYRSKGDIETAKAYEKLSDKEISQDLYNRERDTKLLTGLAIGVGVAAAVGIGYYAYQHRATSLALEAASQNGADMSELLDKGVSVKLGNTIVKEVKNAAQSGGGAKDILNAAKTGAKNKKFVVDANGKLLDNSSIKKIAKAAGDDFDITLKRAVLQRTDGNDITDLSKARNMLFAAPGKKDARTYKFMGQLGALPAVGNQDVHVFKLEMGKDINFPSRKKADQMLRELYENDESFKTEMIKGARDTLEKRGVYFGNKTLDKAFTYGMADGGQFKSAEYWRNWSLAAQNENGNKKVRELFKDYDGLVDYHDVIDKLADFPVAMFNDNNFRQHVKVTKIH